MSRCLPIVLGLFVLSGCPAAESTLVLSPATFDFSALAAGRPLRRTSPSQAIKRARSTIWLPSRFDPAGDCGRGR